MPLDFRAAFAMRWRGNYRLPFGYAVYADIQKTADTRPKNKKECREKPRHIGSGKFNIFQHNFTLQLFFDNCKHFYKHKKRRAKNIFTMRAFKLKQRAKLHFRNYRIGKFRTFKLRGIWNEARKVVCNSARANRAFQALDEQVCGFVPAQIPEHHFT